MTGNRPYRRKAGRSRQKRSLGVLLRLIVVLAVAALLLKSKVFVVKTVEIAGLSRYNEAQVMALAGLSYGQSMLSVEEAKAGAGFSSTPTIELVSFEKQYPSTVRLTVRERQPIAYVRYGGEYLLIDETGCILERTVQNPGATMMAVGGMNAYIDPQGKRLISGVTGQMDVVERVTVALRDAGLLSRVSELDVRDQDNIYVVSDTGVQVILGDVENMENKLAWMQAVLGKLTEQGIMRGVLDVSTGQNAVYADR